ncbi:hypothetical protein BH10ACT3_BH10ACT3_02920 [soil metagenome]
MDPVPDPTAPDPAAEPDAPASDAPAAEPPPSEPPAADADPSEVIVPDPTGAPIEIELEDRTRHRRVASPLAITAVILGGLGTVMALGVVWFFLALLFGIIAATCALVDRNRGKKATGVPTGGATTIGLVLGLACIPLALGALLIIPRAENLAKDSAADLQGDVQVDLDGLEKTATDNVDRLDRTLRELVKENDRQWQRDLDELDRSSSAELKRVEDEMKALLDEFEQSTKEELDRMEASFKADTAAADGRAASAERDLEAEIQTINADIAALRAFVATLGN